MCTFRKKRILTVFDIKSKTDENTTSPNHTSRLRDCMEMRQEKTTSKFQDLTRIFFQKVEIMSTLSKGKTISAVIEQCLDNCLLVRFNHRSKIFRGVLFDEKHSVVSR